MLRRAFAAAALVLLAGGIGLAADSEVPTDFATIQAAIDDAGTMAGDTITVLGAHAEGASVHIDKAITLAGQGIGVTVLTGVAVTLYVDTDDVTIRDMTIDGGDQAIRFEMAAGTIDNTQIVRVQMKDQTSRGIEIHNDTTVTNLLIDDCHFDDCNNGLRVSSSGHLTGAEFRNSEFNDLSIGIYEAKDGSTSSMSDVLIYRNSFHDNGTAIYGEEMADTRVLQNTFMDNGRDFQILKWYDSSLEVSNIQVRNNRMVGTKNAVIGLFNAHHTSGRLRFRDINVRRNTAVVDPSIVRIVYAGAHSNFQNNVPSDGGLGWDSVHINCNSFTNWGTPSLLVDFFDPDAVDLDTLGGAVIDVDQNWWGTTSFATIEGRMELPDITDFTGFLDVPPTDTCPDQPLLVELDSFTAEQTPHGVEVRWSTVFERDTVGFRVLRGRLRGGGVEKSSLDAVMPQMIPSAGGEGYGARYNVTDDLKGGVERVFYLLEDIDLKGVVTTHGPVWVTPQGPARSKPRPLAAKR